MTAEELDKIQNALAVENPPPFEIVWYEPSEKQSFLILRHTKRFGVFYIQTLKQFEQLARICQKN